MLDLIFQFHNYVGVLPNTLMASCSYSKGLVKDYQKGKSLEKPAQKCEGGTLGFNEVQQKQRNNDVFGLNPSLGKNKLSQVLMISYTLPCLSPNPIIFFYITPKQRIFGLMQQVEKC